MTHICVFCETVSDFPLGYCEECIDYKGIEPLSAFRDRLVDLSVHPESCWCQDCDPDFHLELESDWLPEVVAPF